MMPSCHQFKVYSDIFSGNFLLIISGVTESKPHCFLVFPSWALCETGTSLKRAYSHTSRYPWANHYFCHRFSVSNRKPVIISTNMLLGGINEIWIAEHIECQKRCAEDKPYLETSVLFRKFTHIYMCTVYLLIKML